MALSARECTHGAAYTLATPLVTSSHSHVLHSDVEETMKDFGGFSGVTMTKRGLPGPTPPMAAINKDVRALVIHS